MTSAGTTTSVVADLRVEVDGHPVTIVADGRHVLVSVPEIVPVLAAAADVPGASVLVRRAGARTVAESLAHRGVTVSVEGSDGRLLLVVGRDAMPGRIGRFVSGTGHLVVTGRALRSVGAVLAGRTWSEAVSAARRRRTRHHPM